MGMMTVPVNIIWLVPSSPLVILPLAIPYTVHMSSVQKEAVIISFQINKTLWAPVVIFSIGILFHGKAGGWSNDKRNIRPGIIIRPACSATADYYNGCSNQCKEK
jgi:hypothetical protein